MTNRQDTPDKKESDFAFHWYKAILISALVACSPQVATAPTTSTAATDIPSPMAIESPTSLPTMVETIAPTITIIPTATRIFLTNFPDPSGYQWMTFASGLQQPVDIQNAGDGSGRLFIVERGGEIRILQNGQLLPSPFLDIKDRVTIAGVEQGLLGLAFHPNYTKNGEFFVNYIDLNGNTVIARFHVSASNPNQADPTSGVVLLNVNQPFTNHNGGGLAFGPDGYLYIGFGDGGSERDPNRTGQNLQTLLGKMLRIDVNDGDQYTIPPDNPFINGGGLPEIWASGLRNPWRFSFDRLTGDLYIADVGQDQWEEIDYVQAGTPGGMNFGWSFYEGMHQYNDQPPANIVFTFPVIEYSHSYGCAVTGGYVYRGSAYPEWQGVYFYGDYCSGTVWGLIRTSEYTWQAKDLFSTRAKLTTFGTDENGELYLADYQLGRILLLTHR